jgi:hypothetical protein
LGTYCGTQARAHVHRQTAESDTDQITTGTQRCGQAVSEPTNQMKLLCASVWIILAGCHAVALLQQPLVSALASAHTLVSLSRVQREQIIQARRGRRFAFF